jgi:hypothetical protein
MQPPSPPPETSIDPNLFSSAGQSHMGAAMLAAFGTKDTEKLRELVAQGGPVHVRLDCGLSIRLEADFVAALKVILGGGKTTAIEVEAARTAFNYDAAAASALQAYTKDAFAIRDLLRNNSNAPTIPVRPVYIDHLLRTAVTYRDSLGNCALMAATSLIDDPRVDVRDLLTRLVAAGLDVDTRGYFGCNACSWSVIMLDAERVRHFLDLGSDVTATDDAGDGLLHWLAATSSYRDSPDELARSRTLFDYLIDRGADPAKRNRLGLTCQDYPAAGTLK